MFLPGTLAPMALFSREFIAVPDDRKGQIVFKWPDLTIRRFTHAIVNADEVAMFVNTGQVVQTMGPGRHEINADELPGLGAIIDFATGGNAYRAELYFVGTREYTGFRFGGRVDDVQDPRSGLIVTMRVFGDYALRVIDPARLVTNLTATVDVTDNERIAGWVSDQLLKVLRTNVTTQVVANGWPILGLSVHSPEIEQAAITSANGQLEAYGIALTRMGNFDINLSPEDAAELKRLAKDTSYSQLAGGFQQYAAGEMALGAGQGMAQGGGATEGAFLAAGIGLGGALGGMQQQPAQAPPPPAAAPAAGTRPRGRPRDGDGRDGSRHALRARRATRPARNSAWAAVRRSRRPSGTARSAGPSCPERLSSAPTAAPPPGADRPGYIPAIAGTPWRAEILPAREPSHGLVQWCACNWRDCWCTAPTIPESLYSQPQWPLPARPTVCFVLADGLYHQRRGADLLAGAPGRPGPAPVRGQVQSLFEPSRGDDTLPRVLSGLPPVPWRQRRRRPLRQGLTAEPGLAAERSQSRRRSTARSMAWAREVTPSFW